MNARLEHDFIPEKREIFTVFHFDFDAGML